MSCFLHLRSLPLSLSDEASEVLPPLLIYRLPCNCPWSLSVCLCVCLRPCPVNPKQHGLQPSDTLLHSRYLAPLFSSIKGDFVPVTISFTILLLFLFQCLFYSFVSSATCLSVRGARCLPRIHKSWLPSSSFLLYVSSTDRMRVMRHFSVIYNLGAETSYTSRHARTFTQADLERRELY